MTDLTFKGKEFVCNHTLAVPFWSLEMRPNEEIRPARLDGIQQVSPTPLQSELVRRRSRLLQNRQGKMPKDF